MGRERRAVSTPAAAAAPPPPSARLRAQRARQLGVTAAIHVAEGQAPTVVERAKPRNPSSPGSSLQAWSIGSLTLQERGKELTPKQQQAQGQHKLPPPSHLVVLCTPAAPLAHPAAVLCNQALPSPLLSQLCVSLTIRRALARANNVTASIVQGTEQGRPPARRAGGYVEACVYYASDLGIVGALQHRLLRKMVRGRLRRPASWERLERQAGEASGLWGGARREGAAC